MALELPFGYKQTVASSNVDAMYGPYNSIQAARVGVPLALRALGRVVGIIESGKVVDYIWESGIQDIDLVLKVTKDNSKVDKVTGESLVKDTLIVKLEQDYTKTEVDDLVANAEVRVESGDDNALHIEEENKTKFIYTNISTREEEFILEEGGSEVTLAFLPVEILGVYLNGIKLQGEQWEIVLPQGIRVLTYNATGVLSVSYNHFIREEE